MKHDPTLHELLDRVRKAAEDEAQAAEKARSLMAKERLLRPSADTGRRAVMVAVWGVWTLLFLATLLYAALAV
jgi:hypothetical protein